VLHVFSRHALLAGNNRRYSSLERTVSQDVVLISLPLAHNLPLLFIHELTSDFSPFVFSEHSFSAGVSDFRRDHRLAAAMATPHAPQIEIDFNTLTQHAQTPAERVKVGGFKQNSSLAESC
jgi:hypothetical protein